jgi:signal transduction histidine kinase
LGHPTHSNPPQARRALYGLPTLLTEPPAISRVWRLIILFGAVFLIGIADYLTGPRVSLLVFYLVTVALCVGWVGWGSAVVMSALSLIIFRGVDYLTGDNFNDRPILWNTFMIFGMFLVEVWTLHALLTLYRQMEARVQQRTAALEQEISARERLQRELIEVGERERNSVGQALHDGLAQHLTATAFAAKVLADKLSADTKVPAEDATTVVRMVEEGIAQTRRFAHGLLLSAVPPEQLPTELDELAVSVRRYSGADCELIIRNGARAPDTESASHLFRIAQEACRNAVRHARARRVTIEFAERDGGLDLEVADDGVGLGDEPPDQTRMGRRVMAQRARLIGAELTINSRATGGTMVHCRLPLPQRPEL